MRQFIYSAMAVLTVGAFGTTPAAATGNWICMGPPPSCVSDSAKARKHTTYKAQKAYKKAYKKSYTSKKSYSYGGSSFSGMASYYWQGTRTASGARFNPSGMTAAHKTLPFGTKVRVTNKHNGKSVVVTINDRGPFIKGRVIDLSSGAAGVIGMKGAGVVPVAVTVIGRG